MTDASLYSYWIFARVVIRNMLSALVLPRVCVDCNLSEIGGECDEFSVHRGATVREPPGTSGSGWPLPNAHYPND